jgi:hypothetical protein
MHFHCSEVDRIFHDFSGDAAERRQYRRINLHFPLWWMKDVKADAAVAGIGLEISGGGIQFLLQEPITQRACTIAVQIKDRRMLANIVIILAAEVVYEEQTWLHHRAKFLGLRDTDFDYIMALTSERIPAGAAAMKGQASGGAVESYEMLPISIKEDIVRTLVSMKRLARPRETQLASLVAHYGGLQPADKGTAAFHRFSIRTKMNSARGELVFDTHFLISEDGTKVIVRE